MNKIENCTLIWVSDVRTGTSKTGNDWMAMDAVFEIPAEGEYKQRIVCSVMKRDFIDTIQKNGLGSKYNICFDFDAREHNGKWYGSNRLWSLTAVSNVEVKQVEQPQPQPQPKQGDVFNQQGTEDDLPF